MAVSNSLNDGSDNEDSLAGWLSADYARRRFRRWRINERAVVKFRATAVPCLVQDISPGGASIVLDGPELPALEDMIVLEVEGAASILAEVRHSIDGQVGIMFLHDSHGERAVAEWLTRMENTRRRYRRLNVHASATLSIGDNQYRTTLKNIALGGASVLVGQEMVLKLGERAALEIEGVGIIAVEIRHKTQGSIGLRFDLGPEERARLAEWLQALPD